MKRQPDNLMIWNAARGGMRSVVEAYHGDGFLEREQVRLIASYVDGGVIRRQVVFARALVEYLWCLLTRRVGLVHIHAAMRGSFWRKGIFASIARLFGKPVLLHLHGSEMKPFYDSQPKVIQALVRRHLEAATRVLVLSESWRAFIASIAPRARIVVVPNYVSMPLHRTPEEASGQEVLFLGLVGGRKGVFDLIPAFAEVVKHHPAARLVIGGNGELDRAAAAIRGHGLAGSVELAGWIDGEKKAALLARAVLYVLPSHNEGLPMSVLEAMSWGLPVVTTRVGGLPELISDGVDGLLVNAGDTPMLAGAIVRLLGDAGLRASIGKAGRMRVEQRYSSAAVLPVLRDIYDEVLQFRPRSDDKPRLSGTGHDPALTAAEPGGQPAPGVARPSYSSE